MRTSMKWIAVAVVLAMAPRLGHSADDTRTIPVEVPVGGTIVIALDSADQERVLTEKTKALIELYGRTEEQDRRTKLREELAKIVAEHFDVRHARRAKELKDLEEQVKRLRELQEQRATQRDRIIQDRVESLLLEADGLGWGKEPDSNASKSTDPFPAKAIEVPAVIRQNP